MTTIRHDMRWQSTPAVAGPYRPWLLDKGSLTARIVARCSDFTVAVLFQGLRRPNRDERFLFPGKPRLVVREVVLYCGRVPVVFAHTVLSRCDLRGTWRGVRRLGNRPLGAALFADPRITRYALRTRKIGIHHELYRRVHSIAPPVPRALWARRSLFRLHNSPILVTEVFLPEILDL